MNNKGFAISGIIYTLFILFLLILVTALTGLNTFQKLINNTTTTFETTFSGEKIENSELTKAKKEKIAPYSGKYIFNITKTDGETNDNCMAYLAKGTNWNNQTIIMSPEECNANISQIELSEIYSFEGDS